PPLCHASPTRRSSDLHARNVSQQDAYDYIAGYTVANDYAIRDYLENYYRPNLRVKNRDGCTPIGPWLVDAADVPDPMDLVLSTSVNGKETQRGTTRDMVFSIPWLIEYLSAIMTLSPGDIIDRKSTRLNSSHVKNSYAVFC